MADTVPMTDPPDALVPTAETVVSGAPIPAITRLQIFSADQWEDFVLEWAHSLRAKYALVERCGGPGDMGRDVIATPNGGDPDTWDNFQCKHYGRPLRDADIWIEIGKLVYHTWRKEFSYPRKYAFVAPQGAGTKLANLLKRPDRLRDGLITKWDQHCKFGITSTSQVALGGDLRLYLDDLDFSIFGYIPPLQLIDGHRETPYHAARFGGGLPLRPAAEDPPSTPSSSEMVYLRKLWVAYGDHLNREVGDQSDIADDATLSAHYADSRIEFYSAGSLRSFSRDTLPLGSYEQLQEDVHDGIRDEIRADHDDGYARLLSVVKAARNLQLTSHPLVHQLRTRDRGGMCHQLANNRDDVHWVKHD